MRPRVASVRVNFAPLTGWPDGSKTDPFREAIMVWPWPKAEAAPKIETIRTHSNTQSFAIRVEADIWTSSPCMAWPEPGPDNPLAGPESSTFAGQTASLIWICRPTANPIQETVEWYRKDG